VFVHKSKLICYLSSGFDCHIYASNFFSVINIHWFLVSVSTAWENRSGICVVVQPHSMLCATHMRVSCFTVCAMVMESSIMPVVHAMKGNGSTMSKVERYDFSSLASFLWIFCHTNVCWCRIGQWNMHTRGKIYHHFDWMDGKVTAKNIFL